jgi:hypothetical protein
MAGRLRRRYNDGMDWTRVIAVAAAAVTAALAHLEPGSLASPRAGGSYAAGSRVDIRWGQAEYHFGNYTLWHSRNAGTSWDPIATWAGPRGDNVTVAYAWTVPDAPGGAHRVRVCQIGSCDEDAYVLISGDFAVIPAASLAPAAGSPGPALRMDANRNLDVSFELPAAGPVALKAYAADGSLAAVLLEGAHAAGAHAYRLSSDRLRTGEALVLRLEASGRTLAALKTAR